MPPTRTPRVIIFEPDAEFRGRLVQRLSQSFGQVRFVSHGQLSELAATLAGGPADVLIIDISQLDGQGTMAVNRVRIAFPDMPVIVLVTAGRQQMRQAVLEAGAGYVLDVPFRASLLVKWLAEALRTPRMHVGRLQPRELADRLLACIEGRETLAAAIETPGRYGEIFLSEGHLLDALIYDALGEVAVRGDTALSRMLRWPDTRLFARVFTESIADNLAPDWPARISQIASGATAISPRPGNDTPDDDDELAATNLGGTVMGVKVTDQADSPPQTPAAKPRPPVAPPMPTVSPAPPPVVSQNLAPITSEAVGSAPVAAPALRPVVSQTPVEPAPVAPRALGSAPVAAPALPPLAADLSDEGYVPDERPVNPPDPPLAPATLSTAAATAVPVATPTANVIVPSLEDATEAAFAALSGIMPVPVNEAQAESFALRQRLTGMSAIQPALVPPAPAQVAPSLDDDPTLAPADQHPAGSSRSPLAATSEVPSAPTSPHISTGFTDVADLPDLPEGSAPLGKLLGRKIGKVLFRIGRISEHQLREAVIAQRNARAGLGGNPDRKLGSYLVEFGYCTPHDIRLALAIQNGKSLRDIPSETFGPYDSNELVILPAGALPTDPQAPPPSGASNSPAVTPGSSFSATSLTTALPAISDRLPSPSVRPLAPAAANLSDNDRLLSNLNIITGAVELSNSGPAVATHRVVLLEADTPFRAEIAERLNRRFGAGIELIETATADRVDQRLATETVHALIVDLSSPGITGLETLATWHARNPHTTLIVLRRPGVFPGTQRQALLGVGVAYCLDLPFRSAALYDTLSEALTTPRAFVAALVGVDLAVRILQVLKALQPAALIVETPAGVGQISIAAGQVLDAQAPGGWQGDDAIRRLLECPTANLYIRALPNPPPARANPNWPRWLALALADYRPTVSPPDIPIASAPRPADDLRHLPPLLSAVTTPPSPPVSDQPKTHDSSAGASLMGVNFVENPDDSPPASAAAAPAATASPQATEPPSPTQTVSPSYLSDEPTRTGPQTSVWMPQPDAEIFPSEADLAAKSLVAPSPASQSLTVLDRSLVASSEPSRTTLKPLADNATQPLLEMDDTDLSEMATREDLDLPADFRDRATRALAARAADFEARQAAAAGQAKLLQEPSNPISPSRSGVFVPIETANPPPKPVPVSARQRLQEACQRFVEILPDGLAAAILDLPSGRIVARHITPAVSQELAELVAAGLCELFVGGTAQRIDEVVRRGHQRPASAANPPAANLSAASAPGTLSATDIAVPPTMAILDEALLGGQGVRHFVRRFASTDIVMVVVVGRQTETSLVWIRLEDAMRAAAPDLANSHR